MGKNKKKTLLITTYVTAIPHCMLSRSLARSLSLSLSRARALSLSLARSLSSPLSFSLSLFFSLSLHNHTDTHIGSWSRVS